MRLERKGLPCLSSGEQDVEGISLRRDDQEVNTERKDQGQRFRLLTSNTKWMRYGRGRSQRVSTYAVEADLYLFILFLPWIWMMPDLKLMLP